MCSQHWHHHSNSTCLLCKGVTVLNLLNMVCGCTTSDPKLQGNVHTRRPMRRPPQHFSFSGTKSNKHINDLTSCLVSQLFRKVMVSAFPYEATGHGGCRVCAVTHLQPSGPPVFRGNHNSARGSGTGLFLCVCVNGRSYHDSQEAL